MPDRSGSPLELSGRLTDETRLAVAVACLAGIDWLIVGGESGARHRPVRAEWVRDLQLAARLNGTAFFFKQWGGRTPKAGGRELDGRTFDELPRAVAV